jgi:hypothetical protein
MPGEGSAFSRIKFSPTDTTARNTIRVVATITPQREDGQVFFKWVDVDDPSSNVALPNGWDDESIANDNRGSSNIDPCVYTDANGEAKGVLSLSMKPGDNFKVVADCNDDYLPLVDSIDRVADGGLPP